MPIEYSATLNKKRIDLNYTFLNKQKNSRAALEDDFLYFKKPFKFTLDKLYSSDTKELTLDYEILSIKFKKQTILGKTYLIGAVDTYIENWQEYGQPFRIILKSKSDDNDSIDEDDEAILALAAQEQYFIKLYPVPFSDQITFQYHLNSAVDVKVELRNINGGSTITLAPFKHQEPGDYTYTVPVNSSLPQGLYVVRLQEGANLHTRLIVKSN
ncbi:T9SS type A sorting domain-containing protein [Cellulophaga baltica 4]|nr:T9SS type A sorting domain-containing protein [Cellulophaga baltica 4]